MQPSDSEDDLGPRRDFSRTGELMSDLPASRRRRGLGRSGGNDSDSGAVVSQSSEDLPRQRTRLATLEGSSRDNIAGSSTPTSRRLSARSRRQSERQMQLGSAIDDDEITSQKSGPRSPMRGDSRRKRQGERLTVEDEDDDEEDEQVGQHQQLLGGEDEDEAAIVGVDQPQHMLPLTFLYQPRERENATNPLVVTPVPFSGVSLSAVSRARRSEMDILNGDTDKVTLLGEDMTAPDSSAHFAPNGELLGAKTRRDDGMFVGQSPVLAALLLRGEPPACPAVTEGVIISPQLDLARVTQRTLRDLQRATESQRVRQEWARLQRSSDGESPRPHRGSADEASTAGAPPLAPARLLQQLSIGPMTQLIENPVDSQAAQPVLPEVDASYGGRLGNWSASASVKDRLGVLPGGDRSNKFHRSVLRVHVHQISLLDHPLVSEEERAYASLKSSFAVYRSLMEQQTLPYLSQRLIALHTELTRLLAEYDGGVGDRDEDEDKAMMIKLSAALADLTETLPTLTELRLAVDSLTAGLYEQWQGLQKIRRDQGGFCSTKAALIARRVQGGGGSGVGSRGGTTNDNEDDDEEGGRGSGESKSSGSRESSKLWNDLATVLGSVPAIVRRVQTLLITADKTVSSEAANDTLTTGDTASVANATTGGRSNRGKLSPRGVARETSSGSSRGLTPQTRQSELRERQLKIATAVETACTDLLKVRGLIPEYVLRLSDTGTVTPTAQVNADEQRRRRELEALQFKVVVRVNSQVITHTAVSKVTFPNLSVELKQFFEFRLLHQPSSLELDIVTVSRSSSGFLTDTYVASVCVPLPGQKDPYLQAPVASGMHLTNVAAGTLAPSIGWLAFSSEGAVLGRSTTTAPSSGSGAGTGSNMRGALPVARTSGLILCAAEYDCRSHSHEGVNAGAKAYDGIAAEDLAQLPSVVPIGSGALFSAVHKGSRSSGISQSILQGYLNLDPNDPRNDSWLRSVSARGLDPGMDRPAFHLDGLDFAVPFGEDGYLYENYARFQGSLRMQLLLMRQANPHLFSEPIPMTDAEIRSKEIFKALLALEPDPLLNLQLNEETGGPGGADVDELRSDSKVRSKISSFMDRVRQGRVAQSVKARKKLTTTGTVAEVQYFVPVELQNLDHLLPDRKRSLRPVTKPRQPTAMQVQNCDLLIQVVGARNVPLREEKESGGARGVPGSPKKKKVGNSGYGSSGSSGESDVESRSRGEGAVAEEFLDETKLEFQRRAKTFVEVRFQEHARRTGVNAGRSPLWKESLSIPFRPPQNDFTPANLSQVRDNIYFSLFDECAEDYSWSGSFIDGESPIYNERRYLGSFVVPFSTVWASAGGRIEGVFRLDLPCINFGYVPAPPLENVGSLTRSMFQDDASNPQSAAGGQDLDLLRKPTLFEAMLSVVLPKRTFQSLVAGWSKRRSHNQSELQDFGVQLRPAMEKEFEYYSGNSSTTYIKLMITLDPILVSPPHIPEEIAQSSLYPEDKSFAGAARSWLRSVHGVSKFTKERPFKLFGANTRGLNVLLCRYLVPMSPPPGFNTRRACIHLVSLLPFMADAQSFQGESDLWCTAKEAWDTGAGDEEEHATILYNYLYYLEHVERSDDAVAAASNLRQSRTQRRASQQQNEDGRPSSYPTEEAVRMERVFLVVGKAVPEGDSVYVMLRDELAALADPYSPHCFVLINPCTGQMFPASDPRCPLMDVSCLVTPYNVWANIQPGSLPCDLSYDILNPDLWRPFFGRRLPPPPTGLHSIQEDVQYEPTSSLYTLDIERAVRESIVANLRKWRAKRRNPATSLHPDMSAFINDMLPKLEQWKRSGKVDRIGTSSEGLSPLEILQAEMIESKRVLTILQTRKLLGAPINMAFTDVEEVLAKVKSLCIHETNHPEVQFVVAVRAFPLVNDLVSLWIFVGCLQATGQGRRL